MNFFLAANNMEIIAKLDDATFPEVAFTECERSQKTWKLSYKETLEK